MLLTGSGRPGSGAWRRRAAGTHDQCVSRTPAAEIVASRALSLENQGVVVAFKDPMTLRPRPYRPRPCADPGGDASCVGCA